MYATLLLTGYISCLEYCHSLDKCILGNTVTQWRYVIYETYQSLDIYFVWNTFTHGRYVMYGNLSLTSNMSYIEHYQL